MTVADAISLALKRCGLEPTATDYRAQATIYLNATMADIDGHAAGGWWWRFKDSHFHTVASTRYYELAADVLYPVSFRDFTNDRILPMATAQQIDAADPDADETGSPARIFPSGVSTVTGYQKVGVSPVPDAIVQIDYRYYASQTAIADDSDDLLTDYGIPLVLQPAVWLGTARLYLQEEQDLEASMIQQQEYERVIKQCLGINARQRGTAPLRLGRYHGQGDGRLSYQPSEGSLH
jgi:hypothetical protein